MTGLVQSPSFSKMKRLRSKFSLVLTLVGVGTSCRNVSFCTSSLTIVQSKELSGSLKSSCLQIYAQQKRFQSGVADKKFHCSVCKKGFRLEMAAKVHIQQAHNGDGTVEIGVGPGQSSEPTSQVLLRSVPPKAPIKISELVAEEKKPARRSRPTPKPLHEPDRSMSSTAMEEMLKVWDTVGLKRLGQTFVHSSMIMKVFAAKPSEGENLLYERVLARGASPFTGEKLYELKHVARHSCPIEINRRVMSALKESHPFALSVGEYCGPCRPGKMMDPFGKTRLAPEYASALAEEKEGTGDDGKAPLTPFGQLPLFGQEVQTKVERKEEPSAPVSTNEESTVASPFSGMANSPFARAAATPFSSSPFAVHETASSTTSPTSSVLPSSPFSSSDAGASPFSSEDSVSPLTFKPSSPVQESVVPFFIDQSAAMDTPEAGFQCKTCDRVFESFGALRMHSKAKHNISLPPSSLKGSKGDAPDIPAYIPSPVNLSLTSPFSAVSTTTAWPEVELNIFTQSISNTTIIGIVDSVESPRSGVSQISVTVSSDLIGEEDKITVQCHGVFHDLVSETIGTMDKVFISGSLRLLPIYEPANKKYYSCPVVHVALPTGTIAKIQ